MTADFRFSLFFFKKEIFKVDFDLFDKILIFLFSYILFCTLIKNIFYFKNGSVENYLIFIKSVLFLRFLVFYFIVKFLINENIINFKIFFITAFISVTFVCIDVIYQLIFGYDIFGYEAVDRRLSGPFGDELIAGSFVQRFSLISLFLIPIFIKFKKNFNNYVITIFLIILYLFVLVLSGNRIPLVFFIFSIIGFLFSLVAVMSRKPVICSNASLARSTIFSMQLLKYYHLLKVIRNERSNNRLPRVCR